MDITTADFPVILLLIFLEGVLSIDNALVIAMLARPLPQHLQRRALTYGLLGAVVFRLVALGLITTLEKYRWIKVIGGLYLLFISAQYFFKKSDQDSEQEAAKNSAEPHFWRTVIIIELTDIAFAADSILAAVALTSKFWVIFIGGIIGVVMMRFSARLLIDLLNRFHKLERTAYQLVTLIGIKVLLESYWHDQIDFHQVGSPAFFIFWALMVLSIGLGFSRGKYL